MGSAWSRPSCVIRKGSQLPTSLLVHSSPETGHLQRGEDVTSWVTPGHPSWHPERWPGWTQPCPCRAPSSLGAPAAQRGLKGRAVQGSPMLPSPRTSHCSPDSCKALKFQDSTCPPGCFGLRMDESVSAAAPDAINKELAMDKCSEAVNALCICSAFKICAWPVSSYCLDTRPPVPAADPQHAGLHPWLHSCGSWGKEAPGAPCKTQGAGQACATSAALRFGSTTLRLELGPSTCGFLIATSLPLTPLALPLEIFFC